MAKPNYSFEKRQRELAKKKKQDEKNAKKREARGGASAETMQDADGTPAEAALPVLEAPVAPAAPAPRIHRRTTPTT